MSTYFVQSEFPYIVSGTAPDGWTDADAPAGFWVRTGVPEQPVATLWYNTETGEVEVIPTPPSDTAVWNGQEWVEPTPPTPPTPEPEWDELFLAIQGSVWFQKLYAACEVSPHPLRGYVSAVMAWISRNFELLAIALQDVVDALSETPYAYSAEEVGEFNQLLSDRHFDIELTVEVPDA